MNNMTAWCELTQTEGLALIVADTPEGGGHMTVVETVYLAAPSLQQVVAEFSRLCTGTGCRHFVVDAIIHVVEHLRQIARHNDRRLRIRGVS
jgi:hypothetical protein